MKTNLRSAYFVLFALSGFSGLIYESIWTHYLKLFLGHAAYAQTLVLAIFMGGLCLGSFICSSCSGRWKNLITGYALVEGIIGVAALVFHSTFVCATGFAYETVIPMLGSPLVVDTFKWTLSAALILPQSVLLGMTFPLMSGGILRAFPREPGGSLSMLYFTNSIGASIGVLISGFLLVRLVGLPGTILAAGVINVCIAAAVLLLQRTREEVGAMARQPSSASPALTTDGGKWILLGAALLTGLTSFFYEIGWIRMLSLVLGSSTHAFELMLSAFILGLACGSLWIRRRIDAAASPVRLLVFIQIIMGITALLTLPLYGGAFTVMAWLMKTLPKNDAGYFIYNLASHGIASAVMIPSTFCAGMTLPLITHILIRKGHGEGAIGSVYAFNTIGAISGVLLAVHIAMPATGIKGVIASGACIDILLGLVLLLAASEKNISRKIPALSAAAGLLLTLAVVLFVTPNPYLMASGVYRVGELLTPDKGRLLYHRDGKTATVSVLLRNNRTLSIRTNGKADAAMHIGQGATPHPDEFTMILLAAIPMSYKPDARTVANIGLGSGLTTDTLLANPYLTGVDTVEIEARMVEAARFFGNRASRVYEDPRSSIFIDDAKTFFSSRHKRYDIIVSEPSNPWVSGVASLFSEGFYRRISSHLAPDGIFAQWVQLYEIDSDLVASIFKALSGSFNDYVVYAPNYGDMLIIAGDGVSAKIADPFLFRLPQTRDILYHLGMTSLQDIAIRKVGDMKMLQQLIRSFPLHANSDYFPVLDQNAARTRFFGKSADILSYAYEPLPIVEMLAKPDHACTSTNITAFSSYRKAAEVKTAMLMRDLYLQNRVAADFLGLPDDVVQEATLLKDVFTTCRSLPGRAGIDLIFNTGSRMMPFLCPPESEAIWTKLLSHGCGPQVDAEERAWIAFFRAVGARDAEAIADSARLLLAQGKDLTPVKTRYLVAASMLGNIAAGRKEEARLVWQHYSGSLFTEHRPGMLFRLLEANSRPRPE